MNSKQQILTMLREEFNLWEEFLAGLNEEQITAPQLPSTWSIKDEIVHLWAWQQRTVARQIAALHNSDPDYPRWHEAGASKKVSDVDPDEDVDQANDWIYEAYRDKPWPRAYEEWREQFLRLLELVEAVPEKDLLDPSRYEWMEGYPLSESLQGTYEHHGEHLETLRAAR